MSPKKIPLIVATIIVAAALCSFLTYKKWAYDLARITHTQGATEPISGFPAGGFFGYELRKKADWMPGANIVFGPLNREEYESMKKRATASGAFHNGPLYGEICYFNVDNPMAGIGGMPSNYEAKDHDLRLEAEALSAAKLMEKLDEYKGAGGRYPDSLKDIGHEKSAWRYHPGKGGDSYSIAMRLGWDPCLCFEKSPEGERWVFAPGDGSPDREIKLSTHSPTYNRAPK